MSSVGSLSVELELNGDGSFTTRVNRAGDAMDNLADRANRAVGVMDGLPPVFSKVSGGFDTLVNRVTHASFAINEFRDAAYTIYEVFGGLVEKIVDVNANIEKITATFRGMSTATTEIGRTTDALKDLNTVMSMAASSPFSLDKLAHSLVQLKNANLDDPAKSLKTVADAVAHFGGGDEEIERVTLAMQQMAGKGVVSLEELRQQMGEALPGAMQAMANGMNISIAKLTKMITMGTVESKNAMSRMLDEFDRMYGGQSAQKMQTFTGQVSVLTTNLQKAALAAGGMNMDGSYDNFSSYTAITNVLKNLNETLSSPEMRRAALELNDNLRQVANVFASLAKNTDDWMNKLIKFGEIAITTIAALKAIRVAAMGVNAIGGILGATRVGAEVATSSAARQAGYLGMYSGAAGAGNAASVKSGFSTARGIAAGIAEQGAGDYLFSKAPAAFNAMKAAGVSAMNAIRVAGVAAGDALGSGLFNVMTKIIAAGEGGLGFTAIVTGISGAIAPLIPGLLAAAAAFGVLYGAYKIWEHATSGVKSDTTNKSVSDVMKGITDVDTVKSAHQELQDATKKRQAALDAINQINRVQSGQQQEARLTSIGGYGDTKGVNAPNVLGFAPPIGKTDPRLDSLKKQYEDFYQSISGEIDQGSTGVESAIDKSIEDEAQKRFDKMQATTDRGLTSVRNTYTKNMKAIADDRAKYESNVDSVSVQRVSDDNDKARALRIQEDNDRLTAQQKIVEDIQKQIDALGKTDPGNQQMKTLNKELDIAKKAVSDMRLQFEASEQAAGSVVTMTAGSQAQMQEKKAQTVMQNLQQKIAAMQESLGETDLSNGSGGKVTASDSIRAMLEETGSLGQIGDDSRNSILRLVDSFDEMNAKLQNSKAIASDFASILKATADAQARINAVTSANGADSALGEGYSKRVSAIQSSQSDILSRSGLSASDQSLASLLGSGGGDIFSSATDSASYAAEAYKKVAQSMDAASISTSQLTPNVVQNAYQLDSMRQVAGGIPTIFDSAGNRVEAFGNVAIVTANKASSLTTAISAVSQATKAINMEKAASSLEAAASWATSSKAQMISLESPAKRYADTLDSIKSKAASLRANAGVVGGATNPQAQAKYLKDIDDAEKAASAAAKSQFDTGSAKANHTEVNELQQLRASNAQLQAQLDGTGTTYAKYYSIIKNGTPAEKAHAQELLTAAQLHDQLTEKVKVYNEAQKTVDDYTKNYTRDAAAAAEAQASIFSGEKSELANRMAEITAKQTAALQALTVTTKNAKDAEEQRAAIMKETSVLQDRALSQSAKQAELQARTMDKSSSQFLTDRRSAAISNVNSTYSDELNTVENSSASEETKQQARLAYAHNYAASMRQAIKQTEGPLESLAEKWQDVNNNLQEGLSSTFSTMTDNMVDALNGATVSWKDFGKTVTEMLEKIALQWAASFALQKMGLNMTGSGTSSGSTGSGILGIASSILGAAGSLFGGSSSSANAAAQSAANSDSIMGNYTVGQITQESLSVPGHHLGGIVGVGEQTFTRTVPASLFANAAKYHTGGISGDEVPAILKKGEGVFTEGQMEAMGKLASGGTTVINTANTATQAAPQMSESRGASAPKITMNVNNQTGAQVQSESSAPRFDGESWVIDTVIKHISQPGRMRNAFRTAK